MWTLAFALILCLAWGHSAEGTIKVGWQGFALMRLGRLALGLWSYRPNRIYFRLEMR